MDNIIIMDSSGDLWVTADDGSRTCPTFSVNGAFASAPNAEHIDKFYGPIRVFQEVK